ncbi:AmmeMemoRadiSam system protein A [Desulfobotulus sp. H1]|uniref:AmmeMemoRadiSam system protein A n=1 Tax=Desulfobotulus pelophilus TaxID=2823377 RepID=A0ABT3N5H7_9BACT|nr:AmmeMemoRadiSam system protein A [Desulfobotulus pelophilus]MCW7752709.1 AmmeMemoRadiSam system protein A [Desulfobotulus pelophilus]
MKRTGLTDAEKKILVDLAWAVIREGVRTGNNRMEGKKPSGDRFLQKGASFVTLTKEGGLRGCIGSLVVHRPLWEDVAANAWNAAFEDPRFSPLDISELPLLRLSVSVLTPAQPLSFASEEELLAQLRPGVDGLTIRAGGRSATFLPGVWEQLPVREVFFRQLKLKAGLREKGLPVGLYAERYGTEECD